MLRHVFRLHAVLISLAVCLPAAVSRAEDFQPTVGSSFSPVDPPPGPPTADESPAAAPQAAVRNSGASHYTIAPWAEPPHDSSVAPRPNRTNYPQQSSYSYWRQQQKPAYEERPARAQPAPKVAAVPSRTRRDVHLAAHADGAEPTSDLPAPATKPVNPMKSPMGSSPMDSHPMGSGAMPGMPMGSSEIAGPVRPCDCPGYWIPDSDFPVPGNWFFGSESLVVRPHQTRNTAFESSPNGAAGPEILNVDFNAGYEAAFRVFAGWQMDCDRSFRFTYTYVFSDRQRSADAPDGSAILSPLGATVNPGDSINAIQHILLNTWDIDNVRKIDLPGSGCGCCWEATWTCGVRIIDLEETVLNEVNGLEPNAFNQRSTFIGAGPRVGFELRRALGQRCMMAFAGADAGLLLGGQTTTGTTTPSGTDSAQIVPDFDLRIGVCWQPRPEVSMSAGWMFEIFGDAIMLNQDATTATLVRPAASSLSYDGLFLRGEVHF